MHTIIFDLIIIILLLHYVILYFYYYVVHSFNQSINDINQIHLLTRLTTG